MKMQTAGAGAIGAVIAAAGLSSRMGEFKPLLKLGDLTFVRRTIANFRQAGVFPIVLVTGYRADELEKHVAGDQVICVRNPDYAATEMIDSLRIGLEYLQERCDGVFASPVDTPLFSAQTVRRLMESSLDVVRPSWKSRSGHPVLFRRSVFSHLLKGDTGTGLAGLMKPLSDDTQFVEVTDEGITKDADTPEEYRDLLALHNRQLFRPEISVCLRREQLVLSPETALLLQVIDYDGTVKSACSRLHISYRRAWNLLAQAEEAFGRPLVVRSQGGEYGGASSLTPDGADLLHRYRQYVQKVEQSARDCFEDYFPRRADENYQDS